MAKATEREGLRRGLRAPLPRRPAHVLVAVMAVLATLAVAAVIVVVVRSALTPIANSKLHISAPPTAAASVAPSVGAQTDAVTVAVIAAYSASVQATVQAESIPDPESQAVQATTTGDNKTHLITFLISLQRNGVAVRGDLQIVDEPKIVSLTSGQAVLKACEYDTTYLVSLASGTATQVPGFPPPGSPPEYGGVTVTLVQQGGAWKVSSVSGQFKVDEATACTAGF